jgi:hypothetical protein
MKAGGLYHSSRAVRLPKISASRAGRLHQGKRGLPGFSTTHSANESGLSQSNRFVPLARFEIVPFCSRRGIAADDSPKWRGPRPVEQLEPVPVGLLLEATV